VEHVLSHTADFSTAAVAAERLVPVTTVQWLVDSCREQQKKNYRLYFPAPAPPLAGVVLCAANNLPQGDKDAIYTAVRLFGGQYLDSLSRYTTHLVAVDRVNSKAVVAAHLRQKQGLFIKVVHLAWFAECLRQQRRVDEEPYLLSDPVVCESGQPNAALVRTGPDIRSSEHPVLAGKRVYVSSDFNMSKTLVDALEELIRAHGGTVVREFDENAMDVFVGRFRSGERFRRAFALPRVHVGLLPWLFKIIASRRYLRPADGSLLDFPVPKKRIPGFHKLRISVTSINGDARHYLAQLISNMGAVFTKTLDCKNDVLVCGCVASSKYLVARSRWRNIKLVNHLWIEECFARWQLLDPADARYAAGATAARLGKTRLPLSVLAHWSDHGSEHLGVEDSDEEGTTMQPGGEKETCAEKKTGRTEWTSGRADEPVSVSDIPSSPVPERACRSAKQKASLKLHSDIEDLNKYTSMSKSSHQMEKYMHQLELAASTHKRDGAQESAKNTQHKKKKPEDMRHTLVMTGCEHTLVLSRSDMLKLARVGLKVVSDYTAAKRPVDTIVAPKVLRTEKFLKCLSRAHRIIHPSYLSAVLSQLSTSAVGVDEFHRLVNIDDYALECVLSEAQVNHDLCYDGPGSGLSRLLETPTPRLIFAQFPLNLSTNLNGGAPLIESILQAHGLRDTRIVKLGAVPPDMVLLPDGQTVVVAHKQKDLKFRAPGVTVVDWNWCVQCMFHGEIVPY
ncbi:hypothetical protein METBISCDRAFT_3488, partial [Metschnikowia bicuspidata]